MKKCNCGNIAQWLYMPSFNEYPFYCDDCVPRGCSCNNTSLSDPIAKEVIEEYEKGGFNYKIENGNIIPLDEQNREHPCCEYDYDKDGFDFK